MVNMELPAEETLSQAFDKLTHTYDYHDIRAGLLAVDTYLAMVCAAPDSNPNVKASSFISEGLPYPTGSRLASFRALQDGFQYNSKISLPSHSYFVADSSNVSSRDTFDDMFKPTAEV
ncbi:hypothetical protein TWF694_004859 [Orbilia ellipsospora]|uniref:Uncharacterized protein n=1 Tax=Orbilia ellipsospora TaxID=2528407 RepID=A0AAV9WZW1_9PEZI